jgi:hypothetical protein
MGMIGYIIGGTLTSLLVPVLILVAARFIGSMQRNPKVVYTVCAVLAVLTCMLAGSSGNWGAAAISAVLALLFLWWGYRRDATVLAPPPAPSARVPRKGTDY